MTREQLAADIEIYHSMIYRFAYGCTGNRFDADDITQDAFIRLYLYKKLFSSDEHKKAFLLRVTANLCTNMYKSAWFRKRIDLNDNIPVNENPESGISKDDEITLQNYILELKQKYRAVIFLHYYEGYTTAEIAKTLKIPESTVTTRLSRARSQLKTKIITDKEIF